MIHFKAEKTVAERSNLIVSKAKELGIPQWRIEEGFSIASDANEEAITSHLTTVANNVKAQLLPGNKTSFPLSDNKPDKGEVGCNCQIISRLIKKQQDDKS